MSNSFAKLTDAHNPKSYANKINGWLPGIIIDTDDPEKLGRVRVVCPVIDDNNPLPNDNDGWVPVITPFTLNEQEGGMLLPLEAGTQVALMGMMGDIKQLAVIGCFHSRKERPFTEFDRHKGITGEMTRSGRITLHDDSNQGKGAEVKYYPTGVTEKVDPQGNKTIATAEGAVLQLDGEGGVRLENEEGFYSVSKDGTLEQANKANATISITPDGKIDLNTPTSPRIRLSSTGVDIKAQRDKITDLRLGLERTLSGAFGGTYNTMQQIKGLRNDLGDEEQIAFLIYRFDEIFSTAELNFDRFNESQQYIDELVNLDPLELGDRAVAQLDFFREHGLDKVQSAIASNGGRFASGADLAGVITNAVPPEIQKKLNLDIDFLDKIVTGNYGDVDRIIQGALSNLIPGGTISDIENMFSLGITQILGELGLQRTLTDLISKVVDGNGLGSIAGTFTGAFDDLSNLNIELSDFGNLIGELGIAQDLFNELGGFLDGAFEYVFAGLDQLVGAIDFATEFINNIDQMIIDFIGFPIPFGLDAIFGYLGQVTGILDKAKEFIDQIKGKISQIEGMISQFIKVKNDTTLAENFGQQILDKAQNLASVVTGQRDLDPLFTSTRKLSQILLQIQNVDTITELPLLDDVLDELDNAGFSTRTLRKKALTPEKLLSVTDTKAAINDFLADFAKQELPSILSRLDSQVNESTLKRGNQLMLEATDAIAFLQGATIKGNQDLLSQSSDNYHSGSLMEMDKDIISMMAPGGKRGFGSSISLDKDKTTIKSPGADLGLGMYMQIDQEKTGLFAPGANQGLGSSIEIDQKEILLKAPGSKNSIGSFIKIDLEQVEIYSPGGDQGVGSNVCSDLNFLRLNGPGESDKNSSNTFIRLNPNNVEIFAPGGANNTASEFVMDADSVHCRAGSDFPVDIRARFTMDKIHASWYAPYELTLFNSYIWMDRLKTEINGSYQVGPNSNLWLGSTHATLAKRQTQLETSAIRLTDITIDCHAGLVGAGSSYFMGPQVFRLNNGPGGSFTHMLANVWHAAPVGGRGIFMVGGLVFIN